MTPKERYDFICELRRNGATIQHIAASLGVSPQRVSSIMKENRERGGRGQGIPCPECGGDSRTIRTLPWNKRKKRLRRRHKCLSCGFRWSSDQVNSAKSDSTATDSLS